MQCVSANVTNLHLLGTCAKQSSVNSVSTVTSIMINQYQLIEFVVSSKCQKVTFSSDSSRKMVFWLSLAQIQDWSSQQALQGRTALKPVSVELALCINPQALTCTVMQQGRCPFQHNGMMWLHHDTSKQISSP